MEDRFRDDYLRSEDESWWVRGRSDAVIRLLDAHRVSRDARILDIGCSGGPMLAALRDHGFTEISGIDVSEEAVGRCRARGLDAQVMDAGALEFPAATFDVLIASDVLEHLADDRAGLETWRRTLKPSGLLLVFVPAHPYLWSEHDVVNQHHRRYRPGELESRVREAGFEVLRSGFWNNLLLIPATAVRSVQKVLTALGARNEKHTVAIPPRPVSRILERLLVLENQRIAEGRGLAFGVSAFAVARA